MSHNTACLESTNFWNTQHSIRTERYLRKLCTVSYVRYDNTEKGKNCKATFPSHLSSYMQSWPWDLADRHQDRLTGQFACHHAPSPPPATELCTYLYRTWTFITVTPTAAVGCSRGGHKDLIKEVKEKYVLASFRLNYLIYGWTHKNV
jgi:hypothetical protein